jgi:hypothetical protein
MDLNQLEREMIIHFCEDYMLRNKKIYENTIKSMKYKTMMEKCIEKVKLLQEVVDKYNIDETNYKNRMVNINMHSHMHKVRYQIEDLCEEIKFYNDKICNLEVSEEVYFNYVFCQNDFHRLKKLST